MFSSPSVAAGFARAAAFEEWCREDDDERETAKWSCDVVRKKINTFLATKEMTQTAFLKTMF